MDSVFTSLMLSAQTESKLMVNVSFPGVECVMLRCRTYYLPREFASVFVAAVYVPPDNE